jgi:hypothetical protein
LAEKVSGFQLKASSDYLDQAVKEMEDNL